MWPYSGGLVCGAQGVVGTYFPQANPYIGDFPPTYDLWPQTRKGELTFQTAARKVVGCTEGDNKGFTAA